MCYIRLYYYYYYYIHWVRSLVATTMVSVFTVGITGTIYFVALVGPVVVGHVAGSPCVPRSISICWDTGIVVVCSPTVAF